jgi:hypothetical protein
MRVIIAGSRSFKDYPLLEKECKRIFHEINAPKDTIIISGKADGADTLGECFAERHDYKIKDFPADWNNLDARPCYIKVNRNGREYNSLAGFNRNENMAVYAAEDEQCEAYLICFRVNHSPGSGDMIARAKRHNLKVFEIDC